MIWKGNPWVFFHDIWAFFSVEPRKLATLPGHLPNSMGGSKAGRFAHTFRLEEEDPQWSLGYLQSNSWRPDLQAPYEELAVQPPPSPSTQADCPWRTPRPFGKAWPTTG